MAKMRRKIFIVLLVLSIFTFFGGPIFAQEPKGDKQELEKYLKECKKGEKHKAHKKGTKAGNEVKADNDVDPDSDIRGEIKPIFLYLDRND